MSVRKVHNNSVINLFPVFAYIVALPMRCKSSCMMPAATDYLVAGISKPISSLTPRKVFSATAFAASRPSARILAK
jgi:hypothetical protein